MRQIITAVLILLILIGAGLGVARYRADNQEVVVEVAEFDTPEDAMAAARNHLAKGEEKEALKALKIIFKYEDDIIGDGPLSEMWGDLFVKATLESREFNALLQMYDIKPSLIDGREDAALVIADALIILKRVEEYRTLRDSWRLDTAYPGRWYLLDAGALLAEDDRAGAIEHLKAKELEGQDEIDRLVRLALLVVHDDPNEAWKVLEIARKEAPKNPGLRILRARMLEQYGKTELAKSEFIAAVQLSPENPLFYDELAEHYRRQKQMAQAQQVWKQAITLDAPADVILKAWFWNKVFAAIDQEIPVPSDPETALDTLLVYYESLPEKTWWSDEKLAQWENLSQFLHTHQSTLWLRVVDHLSRGEELQALKLLRHTSFIEDPWAADLQLGLLRALTYRLEGYLPEPSLEQMEPNQHRIFTELDKLAAKGSIENPTTKLSAELGAILNSDYAYATLFLASGWYEVALQLLPSELIPSSFPDWVAYGFTQAMRNNRGRFEALAFASKQAPSDALELLTAEILLSNGDVDAAIVHFRTVAPKRTRIGIRAAWLMTLAYTDKGDLETALDILDTHPHFAETIVGQETRARIYLMQGKKDAARAVYKSIENDSPEAVSFFATEAFARGDFEAAREMTRNLLLRFPNNMKLRENLSQIIEMIEKEKEQAE